MVVSNNNKIKKILHYIHIHISVLDKIYNYSNKSFDYYLLVRCTCANDIFFLQKIYYYYFKLTVCHFVIYQGTKNGFKLLWRMPWGF